MPVDDFLDSGVLLLDNDIQERVSKASSRGNVLRYACVVECSSSRYIICTFDFFIIFYYFVMLQVSCMFYFALSRQKNCYLTMISYFHLNC